MEQKKTINYLQSDEESKTTPQTTQKGVKVICHTPSVEEIAGLLDRWNRALESQDADQVVSLYAESSLLLPTLSCIPRETAEKKRSYFQKLVQLKPSVTVNQRWISIGCNMAVDTGIYTFDLQAIDKKLQARYTFTYIWTGDQWLINSHHSSALPDTE